MVLKIAFTSPKFRYFSPCLLQPLERSGQSSLLPHEGIRAAANLFALIVESELKGGNGFLLFFSNPLFEVTYIIS